MDIWKAISYVCLVIGSILLIYGAFVFLDVNARVSQNPFLPNNVATSTALDSASQYFISSAILLAIGCVALYIGTKNETKEFSSLDEPKEDSIDRFDRLEEIVDNNFTVISRRLDKIEEKQKILSQNTLIKAKKD